MKTTNKLILLSTTIGTAGILISAPTLDTVIGVAIIWTISIVTIRLSGGV